jgi:small basic protein (TIGR04137 family)
MADTVSTSLFIAGSTACRAEGRAKTEARHPFLRSCHAEGGRQFNQLGRGARGARLGKVLVLGPLDLYTRPLSQPATHRLIPVMSQHNSLQSAKGVAVKRNVLKRFERVETLKKRGQWKEGDRIVGLRKTKPDV